MSTISPTDEQRAALELFASGDSLAIEAGAGTGKTSTLLLLAENTNRRGQYVAFNKAIVVDAGGKMPAHVRCNTAHSLAFRTVGKRYAHRLNSRRMRSIELANRLAIDPVAVTNYADERKQLSSSYLAGLVMRTVTKFCQSADLEPTERHVPFIEGLDAPKGERVSNGFHSNREVARAIQPAVKRAWADLLDTRGQLPYRHDHYLKAWQLDSPKIGADFILFDEAQDANPVMTAIVAAQTDAQLVWVGDSQQQIYSFTGAINALAGVPADNRTFLTQSFRFGPAIADVANQILTLLDAELRLVGTETIDSRICEIANPNVVLSRTNATAVRSVLGAQSAGKSVHLVGGGADIVSFARAAERLMNGEAVDHPELACFDGWAEVQDYVNHDEQGGELRLLVTLIDDFGVPTILRALDNMTPESRADLIVSTAHKSKGREWDAVQLADDFPLAPESEELRLLYVAATRAKRQLDVDAVELLRTSVEPAPAEINALISVPLGPPA